MKKVYQFLYLLIAIVTFNLAAVDDENETGFYVVESNGEVITLKENENNVIVSDGEVHEAKTSREGYRTISDEEAKFLKERNQKENKSDEY